MNLSRENKSTAAGACIYDLILYGRGFLVGFLLVWRREVKYLSTKMDRERARMKNDQSFIQLPGFPPYARVAILFYTQVFNWFSFTLVSSLVCVCA